MLFKEVKEYSKRQRINLNKDDGLNTGDKIIIMTDEEYNSFKDDIVQLREDLLKLENENQLLQNQEQNLKETIENITAPIYENHYKELENKDQEIKQLSNELNTLKMVCSQFNIDLMSLSAIDILFRSKHKQLIDDFNSSLWITTDDAEIVEATANKIPGGNKKI